MKQNYAYYGGEKVNDLQKNNLDNIYLISSCFDRLGDILLI